MYHKIEMHISKFNKYLIFTFLNQLFQRYFSISSTKKKKLKSIYNYLQIIRNDMTNKNHFTNSPETIKKCL